MLTHHYLMSLKIIKMNCSIVKLTIIKIYKKHKSLIIMMVINMEILLLTWINLKMDYQYRQEI